MKPFKITLIRITDAFNTTNIQQLSKDIDASIISLDKENVYATKQTILNTLVKNNEVQLLHYIFVGKITEDIKDILDIIEDVEEDNVLEEENITELNNHFKYNVQKEWNLDDIIKKKYFKVTFIPALIEDIQNIDTLKHFISDFIDIHPEHQCLIANIEDINDINDDETQEETYTPEKILLHTMYINKSSISLKEQLLSIGIDINILLHDTSETFTKIKKCLVDIEVIKTPTDIKEDTTLDDNECYTTFVNDPYLLLQANTYLTSKLCYHSFLDNDLPVYIEPFLFLYLDQTYKGYNDMYNKEWTKQLYHKTIIKDIGTIKDNNLFLYNFKNIYDFIRTKNTYDMNIVTKGFLKKYFPSIKIANLDHDFSNMFTNKKTIEKYTEDTYTLREITSKVIDNTQEDLLIETISLSHKTSFNNEIDLTEIFNAIHLHNDIPFVKFKDIEGYRGIKPVYKNTYKIYKPSFTLENNNYKIDRRTIFSHNKIEDNICLLEVERNISEGVWVSLKTNGLVYKIIVDFKPKQDVKLVGTIVEIKTDCILIQGGTENKIYRIPKTLHNVPVDVSRFIENYSDTLQSADEVEFYDINIMYGNVDINKHGDIKLNVYLKPYQNDIDYIQTLSNTKNIFSTMVQYIQTLSISSYNDYNVRMLNKNILQIKQTIQQPLYLSSIHKLNVEYTIKINDTNKLNTLKFGSLIKNKLYNSFLLVHNNIFYIGDEVNYKREDGNMLKGKIAYYDDIQKNTYVIIGKGNIVDKNIPIDNIRLLSKDENKLNNEMFHMYYTNISDRKEEYIANFIEFCAKKYCKNWVKIMKQSVGEGIPYNTYDEFMVTLQTKNKEKIKSELENIERIIPVVNDDEKNKIYQDVFAHYHMSYQSFNSIFNTYIKSSGVSTSNTKNIRYYNYVKRMTKYRNIHIMIDYLHPKDNNYTIKIEGLCSLQELQECKDKIKLLFDVYTQTDENGDIIKSIVEDISVGEEDKPTTEDISVGEDEPTTEDISVEEDKPAAEDISVGEEDKPTTEDISVEEEDKPAAEVISVEEDKPAAEDISVEKEDKPAVDYSDSDSDSDDDLILKSDDEDGSDTDDGSLDLLLDDSDSDNDSESSSSQKLSKGSKKKLPLYEEIAMILNEEPKDIAEQIRETDNCIRDRIFYDADELIFSDVVTKKMKSQFSKDCRSSDAHYDNARIPKMLTEENIKKVHEKSYNNVKSTQIEPPEFNVKITKIEDNGEKIITLINKESGDKIKINKDYISDYTIHINHKTNTKVILNNDQTPKITILNTTIKNITINLTGYKLNTSYKNNIINIIPKENIRSVTSNTEHKITLDNKSKQESNYYIFYTIKLINNTDTTDTREYIILHYDGNTNEITISDKETDIPIELDDNELEGWYYTINEEGIDCGESLKNKIKEYIDDDTFNLKKRATTLKCKTLEYKVPNTGEKRFYICPKVWDTYENIPVEPKDLHYLNDEKYIPKQSNWRELQQSVSGIGDLEDVHYKGTDGYSHRNMYKNETKTKNSIPTKNKSILVTKKRKQNTDFRYPGLIPIKDTNDLWPCCFRYKSNKVDKWFTPEHVIKNLEDDLKEIKRLIITKKNVLNHQNIGYVHKDMLAYLYINKNEIDVDFTKDELLNTNKHNIYNVIATNLERSGKIVDILATDAEEEEKNPSMIPLLVRQGIYTADNNSFLVSLLDLLPWSFWKNIAETTWGKKFIKKDIEGELKLTVQIQIHYLLHNIITHLTEEEFKTLNKGSIHLMFKDTNKDISAYQNFLEYILTGKDTEKKYYDFWDYLTRPHEWLFPKGLRLLIFEEIKIKEEIKEYKLVNPYFFDNTMYNDKNVPFSILIKETSDYTGGKDYFKPIYLYWSQIDSCDITNYPSRKNIIKKNIEGPGYGITTDLFIKHIKIFTTTDTEPIPYTIYKQMIEKGKKEEGNPEFIDDFLNITPENVSDKSKQELKTMLEQTKKDKYDTLKDIIYNNIITRDKYKQNKSIREFVDKNYNPISTKKNDLDKITNIFFNIQIDAIVLNIYNYFEHIQTFFDKIINMNLLQDMQYSLQDKTMSEYKHMIINQHNKVVLLQKNNNNFIPINNEQIPHPNPPNTTSIDIQDIYKQQFNKKQNVITLPTIEEQIKELNTLGDISFRLIVDTTLTPQNIYGIIDSYNTIIPVDHNVSTYVPSLHDKYICIDNKVILADLAIIDYNVNKLYQQTPTLLSYERLNFILKQLKTDKTYFISKLFYNNEECIGVKITRQKSATDIIQLFTNIEPILLTELEEKKESDTSTPTLTELLRDKELLENNTYKTSMDEDSILNEYNYLYKLSELTLHINPARYFICKRSAGAIATKTSDDTENIPNICGIVLENNTKIAFTIQNQFHILQKNKENTHYQIDTIKHFSFINKIDFLDNMYYTNRYQLDERIRSINIIQYYEQMHTVIQLSLQRFLFRDPNNFMLKKYIKHTVEANNYNKEEKFLLIYPIIKYICENILLKKVDYESDNIKKIHKMDIKDLDKCYNIKEKDTCSNNHVCSYVDTSDDRTQKKLTNDEMIQTYFIDPINNYAETEEGIDIDLSYITDMYEQTIPTIIQIMKHLLYDATYINCKQIIYEIYNENDFDNIIYKFTYMIVNNYIMQKSILEGEELIKNTNMYVVKDNEQQFDDNDIAISSVNTIFKNKSKYTYDRDKLIIDYILNWNHNSYINIKTHTENVEIERLSEKIKLDIDLSNMSFLNIKVNVTSNTDDTYEIHRMIDEEKVVLK